MGRCAPYRAAVDAIGDMVDRVQVFSENACISRIPTEDAANEWWHASCFVDGQT
jgi:hypothetical protein